jgi:hypothetical protein
LILSGTFNNLQIAISMFHSLALIASIFST